MPEANPTPAQIDIEQVEALRAMVEKSLPRAVIASLERAGVALLLGMPRHDEFQPVIVDPALADELAEKDLVESTLSRRASAVRNSRDDSQSAWGGGRAAQGPSGNGRQAGNAGPSLRAAAARFWRRGGDSNP